MTKAKMVSKALPRLPRGAVSLKSPAAGPPLPSRGGGAELETPMDVSPVQSG